MCLAVSVTCYLHFWQNDQDLLHANVVTQGWKRYQNKTKSQHKVDTEEENSPATPAGTQTCNLSIMTLLLYQWTIPTPGNPAQTLTIHFPTTAPLMKPSKCEKATVNVCEGFLDNLNKNILSSIKQWHLLSLEDNFQREGGGVPSNFCFCFIRKFSVLGLSDVTLSRSICVY